VQKFALLLSFVAVGLAGWAATRASTAPADRLDRMEADLDELRVLETRLANVERRVTDAAAPRPGPVDAAPPRPPVVDGTLAASPRADAGPDAPPSSPVETRIAELTKRLAEVEEKTKAIDPNSAISMSRAAMARALGPRTFVTSLDDAQKQLDLSASQRADWERTLADGKRELDDLRAIPDDQGKTWKQHNEDVIRGLADGSGRIDFSKLMTMRGTKVPGRNETYGEAEARLRTETKRRLRDPLTPDQQKKFDETHIDPLIGGGTGSPVAVTFSTFSDTPKPPDK